MQKGYVAPARHVQTHEEAMKQARLFADEMEQYLTEQKEQKAAAATNRYNPYNGNTIVIVRGGGASCTSSTSAATSEVQRVQQLHNTLAAAAASADGIAGGEDAHRRRTKQEAERLFPMPANASNPTAPPRQNKRGRPSIASSDEEGKAIRKVRKSTQTKQSDWLHQDEKNERLREWLHRSNDHLVYRNWGTKLIRARAKLETLRKAFGTETEWTPEQQKVIEAQLAECKHCEESKEAFHAKVKVIDEQFRKQKKADKAQNAGSSRPLAVEDLV